MKVKKFFSSCLAVGMLFAASYCFSATVTLSVVDESGVEVLELKDISIDKMKINISHLAPGKYYMQVRPDHEGPLKMKRFYVSK